MTPIFTSEDMVSSIVFSGTFIGDEEILTLTSPPLSQQKHIHPPFLVYNTKLITSL